MAFRFVKFKSNWPIIGMGIFGSIATTAYFEKHRKPIQLEAQTKPLTSNHLTHISPQLAYESRSTSELLTNYLILNFCNFYPLLNFINPALDTLDQLKLASPIYWLVKHSLFKHFCGGETTEEMKQLIHRLNGHHIGCILNFTIESKLSDDECSVSNDLIQFIIDTYAEGIQLASQSKGDQVVAIKVSGLASSILLQKVSRGIEALKLQFKQCNPGSNELNPTITRDQLKQILNQHKNISDTDKRAIIDEFKGKSIDYIHFIQAINPFNLKYCQLIELTPNEQNQLQKLITGLHRLGQLATTHEIPILIDAEQSIFQPTIDFIYYELSKNYNQNINQSQPLIYQTYQIYLKKSHEKLNLDDLINKELNLHWGIKLVRGAYIMFERENSHLNDLPNPVHDNIDATHQSYNTALTQILKKISESSLSEKTRQTRLVIASHNINTVLLGCKLMHDLEIANEDPRVRFGQLLGMQDPITFNLAGRGYSVLKCVAYGPTKEVIPFLLRRAQENSTALNGLSHDQLMLRSELGRRAKEWMPWAQPSI